MHFLVSVFCIFYFFCYCIHFQNEKHYGVSALGLRNIDGHDSYKTLLNDLAGIWTSNPQFQSVHLF